MRSSYLLSLSVTLLLAGAYWYQSSASVCPVPIEYRIGEIDQSFGLSVADAKEQVLTAERVWEAAAERDLFVYDEEAAFAINFVFDERQETANSEAVQRAALDEQREQNEQVIETVESLQAEYDALSVAYEERVAAYEVRLAEYNATVNRYNDRGGAPPEVFEELAAEQQALNAEADALTQVVDEINVVAAQLNQLGARGNALVEEYNRGVTQYNEAYGYEREFTQGDFQGDRINIYKFSTEYELQSVLAHEFGHALGIGHVEGEESLMYYLLEDEPGPPSLSTYDIAAYYAICGESETFGHRVRQIIRSLF